MLHGYIKPTEATTCPLLKHTPNLWEGVLGDGLEGNFWEEGLPLCVQSKFEYLHGCSGQNILWQLVPVWDYSDENMNAENARSSEFLLVS